MRLPCLFDWKQKSDEIVVVGWSAKFLAWMIFWFGVSPVCIVSKMQMLVAEE